MCLHVWFVRIYTFFSDRCCQLISWTWKLQNSLIYTAICNNAWSIHFDIFDKLKNIYDLWGPQINGYVFMNAYLFVKCEHYAQFLIKIHSAFFWSKHRNTGTCCMFCVFYCLRNYMLTSVLSSNPKIRKVSISCTCKFIVIYNC